VLCIPAQVFGKDTILNLGAPETVESREQWLEDVDMQASALQVKTALQPVHVLGPKRVSHLAPMPVQDAPSTAERFKDKYQHKRSTPIKGVRMGAGDRSYLVRDDHIDVLKNVYGGVQVRSWHSVPVPLPLPCCDISCSMRTPVGCC
jgi:hypothetical protein